MSLLIRNVFEPKLTKALTDPAKFFHRTTKSERCCQYSSQISLTISFTELQFDNHNFGHYKLFVKTMITNLLSALRKHLHLCQDLAENPRQLFMPMWLQHCHLGTAWFQLQVHSFATRKSNLNLEAQLRRDYRLCQKTLISVSSLFILVYK